MRIIGRNRLSSTAAVLVLAVSITGAVTTFALIDAVLWRSLPYRDPARLIVLVTTGPAGQANVSVPDFDAIRERIQGAGVAAAGGFTPEYALTGFGEPRQLRGRVLSAGFFRTLGVSLTGGREFTQADEPGSAERVAVITANLRQQLFGQREAIGQALDLNGRSYTVVGVLPPYRDPFGTVDLYVPQQLSPTLPRRFRLLIPIVRLDSATDIKALRSQLRVATTTTDPEATGRRVEAIALADYLSTATRGSVQLLFGAGVGLLTIGLLNFAMLVGARAYDRRPEFALRAALGATRMRILALTVMDATALSIASVVGALVLVRALLPVLQAHYGEEILNPVGMNLRVVAFASAIAALAVLTAISVATGAFGRLVSAERLATRSRLTSSGLLVAPQIAVSLVLGVSSVVLVRGFLELRQVDPGFRTLDIHTSRIALPAGRYTTNESRARFWRTLLERLSTRGLDAAISSELPLTGEDNPTSFTARLSDGGTVVTKVRAISPSYFELMGIPVLEGRGLLKNDTDQAPRVVVVNKRLAVALSRLGPAVGQTISFDVAATPLVARVIGIVRDIRHEGLHRDPIPEAYGSFEQTALSTFSLVIRSDQNVADVSRVLRASVAEVDRGQPVIGPVAMSQYVEQSLSSSRFQAEVLSFFASTALVAAATGLYGLLTYLVRRSRREWAIRSALGATRHDLRRQVFRQTGIYLGCGIALGLGVFGVASGFLRAIVFRVSIWDPVALATSVVVLGVVCIGAATIPAWRAGEATPSELLRQS
jgi:putative ABC transport system permease protein